MHQPLRNERSYRILFLIAALYDFILGFIFFAFLRFFFEDIFKLPFPLYPAFFQAAAAFVFVMGIGFYFVYRNMYRNIDIVKVGICFKIVYTGLAFYHVFFKGMPWIFSVFGFLDLVFVLFFIFFLLDVRKEGQA